MEMSRGIATLVMLSMAARIMTSTPITPMDLLVLCLSPIILLAYIPSAGVLIEDEEHDSSRLNTFVVKGEGNEFEHYHSIAIDTNKPHAVTPDPIIIFEANHGNGFANSWSLVNLNVVMGQFEKVEVGRTGADNITNRDDDDGIDGEGHEFAARGRVGTVSIMPYTSDSDHAYS